MFKSTLTAAVLILALAAPVLAYAGESEYVNPPDAEVKVEQLARLAEAVLDRVDTMQSRAADLFNESYSNGTYTPASFYGDERLKFRGAVRTSLDWFKVAGNVQDKAWSVYMDGNYRAAMQYAREANAIYKMLIDRAFD